MSMALSVDLRVRVLAAVADGLSHRQAGERFGVSAASVSRWRKREREQGDCRPLALGGDRRSHGIERHAETILGIAAANDRDVTLAEIKAALAEKGILTSIGGLWRFFDRHRITLKKSRRTRANRAAPTS
jgi:transposase